MVEFYSKEEMAEQVKSYFEDFPEKEISEKDHAYIEEKYENICAVLPEIDEKIAGAAKGWKLANPIFPSCAWVSTRCFTMMISPSA